MNRHVVFVLTFESAHSWVPFVPQVTFPVPLRIAFSISGTLHTSTQPTDWHRTACSCKHQACSSRICDTKKMKFQLKLKNEKIKEKKKKINKNQKPAIQKLENLKKEEKTKQKSHHIRSHFGSRFWLRTRVSRQEGLFICFQFQQSCHHVAVPGWRSLLSVRRMCPSHWTTGEFGVRSSVCCVWG